MKKTALITAFGLSAALALTGCTAMADDSMSDSNTDAAASAPVDTVNSDGAALRATLTQLLSDHVYLAGAAIHQAIADGGDLEAPLTVAAVTALDENSVDVSKAVASVYPDAEQPFLDSWRSHIPFFVNYTLGKATGDQAMADQAVADLGAYAVSFGELINSVVPTLPAETVQAELEMHATTLLAAIDADVAGDPAYFDLLKEAASHMPMTATALAGGIAEDQGIE